MADESGLAKELLEYLDCVKRHDSALLLAKQREEAAQEAKDALIESEGHLQAIVAELPDATGLVRIRADYYVLRVTHDFLDIDKQPLLGVADSPETEVAP